MNGSDDPYKMIHFLRDANKGTTIHSVLTQSNYGRNNVTHFNDLILLDDWPFILNNWVQLCRWIGDLDAEDAVERGKIELYQHLVERLERAKKQRNKGIINDLEYFKIKKILRMSFAIQMKILILIKVQKFLGIILLKKI